MLAYRCASGSASADKASLRSSRCCGNSNLCPCPSVTRWLGYPVQIPVHIAVAVPTDHRPVFDVPTDHRPNLAIWIAPSSTALLPDTHHSGERKEATLGPALPARGRLGAGCRSAKIFDPRPRQRIDPGLGWFPVLVGDLPSSLRPHRFPMPTTLEAPRASLAGLHFSGAGGPAGVGMGYRVAPLRSHHGCRPSQRPSQPHAARGGLQTRP